MGVARQAQERLLNQVFRRVPIVDEQASQPHQRAALLVEQPDDQQLGIVADDARRAREQPVMPEMRAMVAVVIAR